MSTLKFISALLPFVITLHGQHQKSTDDLSFLIGKWEVTRIYSPGSSEARTMKGKLNCDWALDKQYIGCTYDMERPNQKRGLDEVFFNYNAIYDQYESVWLSSTWPIKGIMAGDLIKNETGLTMNSSSEFPIENGVMEYVKGKLSLRGKDFFSRETHIRTSNDKAGDWRHHMTERVKRLK